MPVAPVVRTLRKIGFDAIKFVKNRATSHEAGSRASDSGCQRRKTSFGIRHTPCVQQLIVHIFLVGHTQNERGTVSTQPSASV